MDSVSLFHILVLCLITYNLYTSIGTVIQVIQYIAGHLQKSDIMAQFGNVKSVDERGSNPESRYFGLTLEINLGRDICDIAKGYDHVYL